jgi:hypothetical protein
MGTHCYEDGHTLLRITISEDAEAVAMTLAGRVAGPWVAELSRAWSETAPRVGNKKLSLDLHDVTYSDDRGKQLLREIYAQTNAQLVTGTLWAQYLAEEIRNTKPESVDEETRHGSNS